MSPFYFPLGLSAAHGFVLSFDHESSGKMTAVFAGDDNSLQ